MKTITSKIVELWCSTGPTFIHTLRSFILLKKKTKFKTTDIKSKSFQQHKQYFSVEIFMKTLFLACGSSSSRLWGSPRSLTEMQIFKKISSCKISSICNRLKVNSKNYSIWKDGLLKSTHIFLCSENELKLCIFYIWSWKLVSFDCKILSWTRWSNSFFMSILSWSLSEFNFFWLENTSYLCLRNLSLKVFQSSAVGTLLVKSYGL